MKYRLSFLVGAVIAAFTLIFILGHTLSVTATPTARVPVTWLVGLGGGTTPEQAAVQQQVVADFNASQTAISLTLIVTDFGTARNWLIERIASGDPPDIVGPVGIGAEADFHNYWLDIGPYITSSGYDLSDFDPSLLPLFEDVGGNLTGIPISVYPSFVYYNKDLFDAAGLAYPPHQYGQPYTDTVHGGLWTVDKLEEIAMLLTLDITGTNAAEPAFDNANIDQFGYIPQWLNQAGTAVLFGAGHFADASGNAQIPDNWRVGLNWYYDGMWEKFFIPNGPYRELIVAGGTNEFDSGHIAMALTHSWYTCCLGNVPNWDIAATPAYNGVATAQIDADAFRILKSSQHPAEAFQALAYLTDNAAETLNNTYGGFPARTSLQPAAITDLETRFPGVDWQVLVDSIPYGDVPNHEAGLPNNTKAIDRINGFENELQNVAGLDVDAALDNLKSDLQWIFDQVKPSDVPLGLPGLSYRQVQTFGVQGVGYFDQPDYLNDPGGIYIDDSNNVYVVEASGARLLKYNASGQYQWQFGTAGLNEWSVGGLSSPKSVVADSNGDLWVTDLWMVDKFHPDGTLALRFPQDTPSASGDNYSFNDLFGIAFDSGGRMYLSDAARQRIQVFSFDISGNPVYEATLGSTDSPGNGSTQFSSPRRIAIDGDDNLYVADNGNARVQKCTPDGSTWPWTWTCDTFHGGTWGNGADQLNDPEGVVIDSGGAIYILDSGNDRIKKCTAAGVCSTFVSGYSYPGGLAFDSTGQVFVVAAYRGVVSVFSSSGVWQSTFKGNPWVHYQTDDLHYYHPRGIDADPQGNLIFIEEGGQRLVKIDPAGNPLWVRGTPGLWGERTDGFGYGTSVAIAPSGVIYVGGGGERVVAYNPDGTYLVTLDQGYGEGQYTFHWVSGIAVGPDGDIYVADPENHRVQVYNSSRIYVDTIGTTGVCVRDNTGLCYPQGVDVDEDGNIYIADSANDRIQKYNSSRVYQATIGRTGNCGRTAPNLGQYCSLQDVAVDGQGHIISADGWNHQVQVFDKDGNFLTSIGSPTSPGTRTSQFMDVPGVTVDADGNIYVTDLLNNRIQKFTPGVPNWRQANLNGFGNRNFGGIFALEPFNGKLYAGVSNWNPNGATIWRTSDGVNWTSPVEPGMISFYSDANAAITDLIEFKGSLYAATAWGSQGSQIWRTADGSTWLLARQRGFGEPGNAITTFGVFQDTLYAATQNTAYGPQIWRSSTGDSLSWTNVVTAGLGYPSNVIVTGLQAFNNKLYAAIESKTDADRCQIWETSDGSHWDVVVSNGFNVAGNWQTGGFAVFKGNLYVGVRNDLIGGQVWRTDGANWTKVNQDGFGDVHNYKVEGLYADGKNLYAITDNNVTGEEVWRSLDGVKWTQVNPDGFGDANSDGAFWSNATASFNNSLYFGINNWASGAEIWKYEPGYELYIPLVMKNHQTFIPSTWKSFTSPTAQNLNAITMISPTDGWSVGAAGTILRWTGSSWTTFASPTSADLNGIAMLNAASGWAVGKGGVILKWNGTAWSSVTSPVGVDLNDVGILSAMNAWAVGVNGTLLRWNGSAWATVSSPTTYHLYALDFYSPTDGWAVGGIWDTDLGWYRAAYIHWNGSSWTNYTEIHVYDELLDVDMVSSTYGIAVGTNNAKSFWNGTYWNSSYTIPDMHYSGVDFLTISDGWAVGWVYQQYNIQHWNGTAWSRVASPVQTGLDDIYMLDANNGWAVGEAGVILRYGP